MLKGLLILLTLSGIAYAQATASGTQRTILDVSDCSTQSPPTWCSGSDIGGWINSAGAYLGSLGYGGGEVHISASAGCYQYSTPIVLTSAITIEGEGSDASCLQYLAPTGTAVTYNTGDRAPAGYGLHNLHLAGPQSTGQSTGILINGSGVVLENVTVGGKVDGIPHGFHTGLLFGSNAYLAQISHSVIQFNDQSVYFPGASTSANSGENVIFSHVTFANGNGFKDCVHIGDLGHDGPQVTFISSSFDDCQLVNQDSMVTLVGGHLELASPQSDPYILTIDDYQLGFSGPHSTTLIGTQIFDNPPHAIITGKGLLEVDRYGSLNVIGLSDRGTMLLPLVYLDSAEGGTPKFSIFAPDNGRNIAQLYSIAPGTVPVITNLSNGQFDTRNGYLANGQTVIPAAADGFHGVSGTKIQMSDGSGVGGDFPLFKPDGSLTDSGYGPSAFPTKTGTEVQGHVACWKVTGKLGHCSGSVAADGSCTCN